MTAESLTDLSVLVTRPLNQQDPFKDMLTLAGARPLSLPCLKILPAEKPNLVRQQLQDVVLFDALIFTSTNAVHYADTLLPMPWMTGPSAVLATGPSTSEQLSQHNMPVTEPPQRPYNSEALLNLPTLQQKSLQNVAIIKGEGGRALLAQTLRKQGIRVELVSVYRRTRPEYSPATIDTLFLNSPPDIVTITSNEALKNLVTIAGNTHQSLLLNLPLVVNSERCATLAKQLGFQSQIIVAPLPGDIGQLNAVKQWNRSYRSKL